MGSNSLRTLEGLIMSQTIQETLIERGSRYGSFKDHAELSVALEDTFYKHIWEKRLLTDATIEDMDNHFPPYMQESMKLIFHKIARIANGDPFYDDSWRDIAGYAQLVVDILNDKDSNKLS